MEWQFASWPGSGLLEARCGAWNRIRSGDSLTPSGIERRAAAIPAVPAQHHQDAARTRASLKPRWRNEPTPSLGPGTLDLFRNNHQGRIASLQIHKVRPASLQLPRAPDRDFIDMAEQLLDQVRDLFEGQIVGVPEPGERGSSMQLLTGVKGL